MYEGWFVNEWFSRVAKEFQIVILEELTPKMDFKV